MVDFLQPDSLQSAVTMLSEKERVKILAGGTDVIVQMRAKRFSCDYLLDAKRIPELQVLEMGPDGLEIGAAVTCSRFLNTALPENYNVLKQGAAHLANILLRNRATIIGNICNASPLGDTQTASLVLDGYFVTISARGERKIQLREFFTGPGRHVLEKDELVIKLVLPVKKGTGIFKKKQRIKGHDLAQVNVAAFHAESGNLTMAFGAVGPTPICVDFGSFTKQEIAAKKQEIIDKAVASISPIGDIRSSKEYRIAMVRHYTGMILDELAEVTA